MRLPLHWEVLAVRQRVGLSLEQVGLAILVRHAHHFAETLVPAALVHRKDQVDMVSCVECVHEFARGSVGGRPDAFFLRKCK